MSAKQEQPSKIEIEIDGQSVDDLFIEDILQVVVEESLHVPSMCTVTLRNDYFPGNPKQEKPWQHSRWLQIGKSINVTLQASTTTIFGEQKQNSLFSGEITGIESYFNENSQAPITIRAYDVSHRLHRGRYNRSFQNMTDSDIVEKIAKEMRIETKAIASSGAPYDYIFQENQTNMEFLRSRAFRLGFELYVQDNKLYFAKPESRGSLDLKWLKDLNSFRVRISSAEQVSSVEVRGWNYQEKRAIIATAEQEKVITQNQNGSGSDVSTQFQLDSQPPKMIVVDRPVASDKEANNIAQAICNELGGEFICADARGEGNPLIRVGRVVNLSEMDKYDGKYYITETRHLYHQRVYTTEFTVRGLKGGNLLSVLSPKTTLQPGQTFLAAIVTDNQDPQGWGRVKVKFPTLTEEHASNWARVVSVGAGSDRGFDCLPEINDEVLVGFEHGDIHRPYIIGGVWNGQDSPPEAIADSIVDSKVRLRTIKTRTGHTLQFVEEDKGVSKAGIYLETSGGHQFRLDDSQKSIQIKTSNGHQIEMNDQNQEISVTSTGNMAIKALGNLEIQANGTIALKGAQIFLN